MKSKLLLRRRGLFGLAGAALATLAAPAILTNAARAANICDVILDLGQSNAVAFSTSPTGTGGTPFPGGWTVPTYGAGNLELIWNGSGGGSWIAYNAGYSSYGVGSGVAWGPEAGILLGRRAMSPLRQTYVFKYCLGGVGLSQNPSGDDWNPYSAGKTFANFYTAVNTALGQLAAPAVGLLPVIQEIHFTGCESDCFDSARAAALMRDIPAFVRALRLRLVSPDALFIMTRIKTDLGSAAGPLPYVNAVNDAIDNAAATVPLFGIAQTQDFAAPVISLGHYEPADIKTLGTRHNAAARLLRA
jgi:hypothetical protein